MGKLKLYYSEGGPASRAVCLTIKALNLDVDYIVLAAGQLRPFLLNGKLFKVVDKHPTFFLEQLPINNSTISPNAKTRMFEQACQTWSDKSIANILALAVGGLIKLLFGSCPKMRVRPTNSHAGENKTPEYIKMNPQSTVPTLDDNGKIIWDSHAITRYLATVYGKDDSLCPKDPYLRAVLDQRLHFEDSVLSARFAAVAGPVFRGVAKEFDKDALETLYAAFDLLEIFLKTNSYMVGNNLTVADFSIVSNVTTVQKFIGQLDAARYPKLLAWIDRLSELPYFDEVNTKSLEKMFQTFSARLNNKT